jgi:DNA-binding beta-propeller fold protein YncE
MIRRFPVKRRTLAFALALSAVCLVGAQDGPYKVQRIAKAGGDGGFDYVYADVAGRKLYIPRLGSPGRIEVFSLDTLERVGLIPDVRAHGVAVSVKSNHGFATSRPIAMWNATTLEPIGTIDVQGAPDGILYDPFADRVYVFSHKPPNATVLDASDGSIAGTIDLGGAPEQAVSDGLGRIYVDMEDEDRVAVIDAAAMKPRGSYSLDGRGGACAGLALDEAHGILFVACRKPPTMVIMDAMDGRIVSTLPIGEGTDGASFDPATSEAFSSQADGTLTVIKESDPTSFSVEQTLRTMPGAKTMTLDAMANRIFLISAEFGPSTVGSSSYARHGPTLPGSFSIIAVGR